MSKAPEYGVWRAMVSRCIYPNDKAFPNYGGRGIAVCDEWRQSFATFINDVGARPSPQHTIDRIDNDGNYEPGNVRWATRKEQQANRRISQYITYKGQRRLLSDVATDLGVGREALQRRLKRNNTETVNGDERWIEVMRSRSNGARAWRARKLAG